MLSCLQSLIVNKQFLGRKAIEDAVREEEGDDDDDEISETLNLEDDDGSFETRTL